MCLYIHPTLIRSDTVLHIDGLGQFLQFYYFPLCFTLPPKTAPSPAVGVFPEPGV